MSILQQLGDRAAHIRLSDKTARQVANGFMASYIAGLVLLREQHVEGLYALRESDDIAYWATAVFKPDAGVIRLMRRGEGGKLVEAASAVKPERAAELLRVLNTPPGQVDWSEVIASMMLLERRYDLSCTQARTLIEALAVRNRLSAKVRREVIAEATVYLTRFDKSSKLLKHMRALSEARRAPLKLFAYSRLIEDDAGSATVAAGGGTSTANIGTTNGAMTGNSIVDQVSHDKTDTCKPYIFGKKRKEVGNRRDLKYEKVRKRQRGFKLIRFKAPKE